MHPGKWRTLYRKAIQETDATALENELTDAERAVFARVHELGEKTGTDVEVEKDALDDAAYVLQALRETLDQNSPAA